MCLFKDPIRTAQETPSASVMKNNQLMLYRPKAAVISQIHTVSINVGCGHNVEFFIVTPEGTGSNS